MQDHFRGCGNVVYANVMMDDNREWFRSAQWRRSDAETSAT
jgi:hypothetical protein